MKNNTEIIAPGMYDSIDILDYHNSPGISRSGIMMLRRSPFHYWDKYLRTNKINESKSPSLILGNAVHTYILEPKKFHEKYLIIEKKDKRTKSGKLYWVENENKAKQNDFQLLTTENYDLIKNISNSIRSNLTANELISGGRYENSLYWIDKDTGVLCKCRPDILHDNMICDFKTTCNASYYEFEKDIYNYGYHIQAAMMREASIALMGEKINDFIFILAEKDPPYATAIYPLGEEAINEGEKEFKKLLYEYKKCVDADNWSSYQIKQVSLPSYAYFL